MPVGVYIRTTETRKALSLARLAHPTRYWLGKKRSDLTGENNPFKRPDVIEKIRKFFTGRPSWNKGGHQTPEWKEKIRQANLGKNVRKKQKEK